MNWKWEKVRILFLNNAHSCVNIFITVLSLSFQQKGEYSLSQLFSFFCWIFCCFLTLKLMKFYVFMFLFFIILYFVDMFSVVFFFNSPSHVSFFPLLIFDDFSLDLHLVILKAEIWVYIQINLHGYIFKCAYKLYE